MTTLEWVLVGVILGLLCFVKAKSDDDMDGVL